MTAPTRDEFDIWLADPVTQFVLAGLTNLAGQQAAVFKEVAWNVGDVPKDWEDLRVTKARCRARAEAYADFAAINIEDAYGANGLEAPGEAS